MMAATVSRLAERAFQACLLGAAVCRPACLASLLYLILFLLTAAVRFPPALVTEAAAGALATTSAALTLSGALRRSSVPLLQPSATGLIAWLPDVVLATVALLCFGFHVYRRLLRWRATHRAAGERARRELAAHRPPVLASQSEPIGCVAAPPRVPYTPTGGAAPPPPLQLRRTWLGFALMFGAAAAAMRPSALSLPLYVMALATLVHASRVLGGATHLEAMPSSPGRGRHATPAQPLAPGTQLVLLVLQCYFGVLLLASYAAQIWFVAHAADPQQPGSTFGPAVLGLERLPFIGERGATAASFHAALQPDAGGGSMEAAPLVYTLAGSDLSGSGRPDVGVAALLQAALLLCAYWCLGASVGPSPVRGRTGNLSSPPGASPLRPRIGRATAPSRSPSHWSGGRRTPPAALREFSEPLLENDAYGQAAAAASGSGGVRRGLFEIEQLSGGAASSPATAPASRYSSPHPHGSPTTDEQRAVATAATAAALAAVVLLLWGALAPSALSAAALATGAAALLCCPLWGATHRRRWDSAHQLGLPSCDLPAACGALALPRRPETVRFGSFSIRQALPPRVLLRASAWMGGWLLVLGCVHTAQFAALLDDRWRLPPLLGRLCGIANPPPPPIEGLGALGVPAALLSHLLLCALLAGCCRLRAAAADALAAHAAVLMADSGRAAAALSGVDGTPPRSASAVRLSFAPGSQTPSPRLSSRRSGSRVLASALGWASEGLRAHSLRTALLAQLLWFRDAVLAALLWHASKLSLALLLCTSLSSYDLLHALHLAAFFVAGTLGSRRMPRAWPALRVALTLATVLRAAFLAAGLPSPATGLLRAIGLAAPADGVPAAAGGWVELGWGCALLPALALQAVLFQTSAYRRLAARKGWSSLRDAVRPSQSAWLTAVQRWLARLVLLLLCALPPVSFTGAVCLLALIGLQVCASEAVVAKPRTQRGIWRVVAAVVVLVALGRYAFRVEALRGALLHEGGLLGPACDARRGRDHGQPPTRCTELLLALGLDDDRDYVLPLSLILPLLIYVLAQTEVRRLGRIARASDMRASGAFSLGHGAGAAGGSSSADAAAERLRRRSTFSSSTPASVQPVLLSLLHVLISASLACGTALLVLCDSTFNAMAGVLLCALLGCVGLGGLRHLWLPVGLVCTIELPLIFLFEMPVQLESFLPLRDLAWLGLSHRRDETWSSAFSQMLVVITPRLILLTLATLQINYATRLAAARRAAHGSDGRGGVSIAAIAAAAVRRLRSPRHRIAHSIALALLPASWVDAAGVLWAPVAAMHLARAAEAAVRAALPPVALLLLLAAGLSRLNAWALLYVAAVGLIRFRTTTGPRAWHLATWLLVASVGLQYASALSMPPSVWPPPHRRPWAELFLGWLAWTDDNECARLWPPAASPSPTLTTAAAVHRQISGRGRNASFAALPSLGEGDVSIEFMSEFICYTSLGGNLKPWWLLIDAFAMLATALAAALAAHAPPAASPTPAEADTAPLSLGAVMAGGPVSRYRALSFNCASVSVSPLAGPAAVVRAVSSAAFVPGGGMRGSGASALLEELSSGPGESDTGGGDTGGGDTPPSAGGPLIWCMQVSHTVVLVAMFCFSCFDNLLNGSGLLSTALGLAALGYLSFQREVALSCGASWHHLHLSAYLLLLLVLLFQAPLVPRVCATPVAEDESQGAHLCALWMASLGLFKLDSATALSSEGALKFVLLWLLVDLQARVFAHPYYRSRVLAWHAYRGRRATARASGHTAAASRRARLHVRLLNMWHALQAAKLRRILGRVANFDAPHQDLLEAGHVALTSGVNDAVNVNTVWPDGAAAPVGGGVSASPGLASAAAELYALGFSRDKCERALLATCGDRRRSDREGVTENEMLSALTQLLSQHGRAEAAAVQAAAGEAAGGTEEELSASGGAVVVAEGRRAEQRGAVVALATGGAPSADGFDSRPSSRAPAVPPASTASSKAGFWGSLWSSLDGAARALHRGVRGGLVAAADPLLLSSRSFQECVKEEGNEAAAEFLASGPSHAHRSLLELLVAALRSHTLELLCVSLVLNHAISASLSSLPLPLATFLYLGIEPRGPPRAFFSWMLLYLFCLLLVKMTYQVPLLCGTPPLQHRTLVNTVNGTLYWCASPQAATSLDIFIPTLASRVDYTLGVHKFSGRSSLPQEQGLFRGMLPDLVALVLTIIHRELLVVRSNNASSRGGNASGSSADAGNPNVPAVAASGSIEEEEECSEDEEDFEVESPFAGVGEALASGWRCVPSAAVAAWRALASFLDRVVPCGVSLAGGADYHMSSAFVLLLVLLFLVFGFPWIRADLATNTCATSDFSSQLASSQFDIGMVLSLLLTMLVMVCIYLYLYIYIHVYICAG